MLLFWLLVAASYHDKMPQFYARPGVNAGGGFIGDYALVYAENIKTYGASISTLVVAPPMAGTVTAEELPIAHDPQAAFLALVMSAFDCKCPSHPKPTPAWWAQVRAAGIELQGAA